MLDKKRALSNITYTTCSTLKSIHNISWLGGKQSGGQGGGTISEQASEWLVDCNSLNGCSKNTDKPLKSQWSPLADSAVCVGNKTERETRKRQNQAEIERERRERERGQANGMGWDALEAPTG